jgi:tRNA nucleotidyltransferase (CCA-adding enzyme)
MLIAILEDIVAAGGRPYEVGGCVRDRLVGAACKDIDIEVFQMKPEILTAILSKFGKVDCVGVSFGVIKLNTSDGMEYDFTLPRRESKSGSGHRGFIVEVDHSMTIEEAAARRDFTINAIYRCPLTYQLHDPFYGARHLSDKLLHATSDRFGEDPLRVLRGMQFAARFGLSATEQTIQMSKGLLPESKDLARDRIWHEWEKWALRGTHPSFGLTFLRETNWLSLYPEVEAIVGVQQDPQWHPEGDVWTHTLHVCDAAAKVAEREQLAGEDRIVVLLAALCHDLGKATHTHFENGRWHAYGHEVGGVEPTKAFLERIGCPIAIQDLIVPLVADHLIYSVAKVTPRLVRRLAYRLGEASVKHLVHLIEADVSGRPPLPPRLPDNAKQILEMASVMKIDRNAPRPIMLGRHLIELGYAPSPWFGGILKHCFEAQLDGVFENEKDGLICLMQQCNRLPDSV